MPTKAKTFAQRNPRPDPRPSSAARGYDHRWTAARDYYIRNVESLCRICHGPGEIVHHINEVTDAPELRLDIRNFATLCRPCHAQVHAGTVTVPPRSIDLPTGFWG